MTESFNTNLDLVHIKSFMPMISLLQDEADKYGKDNWKRCQDKTQILQELIENAIKILQGDRYDNTTQLHRIAKIQALSMYYSYFEDYDGNMNELVGIKVDPALTKNFK